MRTSLRDVNSTFTKHLHETYVDQNSEMHEREEWILPQTTLQRGAEIPSITEMTESFSAHGCNCYFLYYTPKAICYSIKVRKFHKFQNSTTGTVVTILGCAVNCMPPQVL